MRCLSFFFALPGLAHALSSSSSSSSHPTSRPLSSSRTPQHLDDAKDLPIRLFAELEELARIVDIAYCVGTTGISQPFLCASRCDEFPTFELVRTFNTGPLMSDSCGYIVLDHGGGRVIVAFRGTYSLANTIVDLSTVPQEYVPYPGAGEAEDERGGDGRRGRGFLDWIPRWRGLRSREGGEDVVERRQQQQQGEEEEDKTKCEKCTVHTGFWKSWQNTRPYILPHLEELRLNYPSYKLNLVGHSLGGAVAALAGLELDALGYEPIVTTFGEPKVGNTGLRNFIDWRFRLSDKSMASEVEKIGLQSGRYRRVTHVDDPVPLLPLREWGYQPHAGEIYISKGPLQPSLSDLRLCDGDEDPDCISGAEIDASWFDSATDIFKAMDTTHLSVADDMQGGISDESDREDRFKAQRRWGIPIPARYKMWQLFFAHRDYFWRLGLCVAGGDPTDWGRDKYDFSDGHSGEGESAREEL